MYSCLIFFCKECSENTYGVGCAESCGNCTNGEQCHHVNGNCPFGCDAGVYGIKCDQGIQWCLLLSISFMLYIDLCMSNNSII